MGGLSKNIRKREWVYFYGMSIHVCFKTGVNYTSLKRILKIPSL